MTATRKKYVMEIFPRAPFAFTEHIRRFTLKGRPNPVAFEGSSCWRLLQIGELEIPCRLTFSGEPWEPKVTVEAWCRDEGEAEKAYSAAFKTVRADLDYREFLRRVSAVEEFRRLAEKYAGLRPGRSLSLYEALIDSIVKQRIALRAALAIQSRLITTLGKFVDAGGVRFWGYPGPEELLAAGAVNLRKLGLTRAKARALIEVARAEAEGRIPDVKEVERRPEEVAQALTSIWGVGRWTAELAVAMVHSGFSVGPAADLSVIGGLSRILGIRLDESGVRGVLEGLGEYRGLLMYLASLEWESRKGRSR